MAINGFRELISEELKRIFPEERVVQFAWRCGVRALPLIGVFSDFSFWKKEDQQHHLLNVFHALDVTAYTANLYHIPALKDHAAIDAANTAAKVAAANSGRTTEACYSGYKSSEAVYLNNSSFVDATASAYYASCTAYDVTNTKLKGIPYAKKIANAVNAAIATANASNDVSDVDLSFQILEDLNNIKTFKEQNISIESYGKVWINFQKALTTVGCEFWARLYQNIFENNFEIDIEALKRRLSVPKEIQVKGALAVANYLEELEKGDAKRLNEARVIILGDKGVGKTSLARKLLSLNAKMPSDKESTPDIEILSWYIKLNNEEINVSIWDFAGHTVTHAVHRFFLSERSLYILLYDGRTEQRNRLSYWLNHMEIYGGDSKAIILVNTRDKHEVSLPVNYLYEQYENRIEGIYFFSIKEDKNELKNFRSIVAEYVRNNPSWEKQRIPENYYRVKDSLRNLFIKENREFITKAEFDILVNSFGVYNIEDIDSLLSNLHALGVGLWYHELKKVDSLILNPNWIIHGVYNIINWLNNHKRYSLTLDDFKLVFREELDRYPIIGSHKFLFNLIKHYELAYQNEKSQSLIIPHLLKIDRPEKIPEFPVGESLKIQYTSKQPLPPNTISRFIVRHNEQIENDNTVWRYGVILRKGPKNIALVREEGQTISVSVKGPKRTEFIAELRQTLNDIFAEYKSKKPELKYWVHRGDEISDGVLPAKLVDLYLSETKILNHLRNDVPYYDDEFNQKIRLEKIAINYNITHNHIHHSKNVVTGSKVDSKDFNMGDQKHKTAFPKTGFLMRFFRFFRK